MSETLDHEVRNFGVHVVLVEPSHTKTNPDLDAPQAANRISAYDADRNLVSEAIVRSVQKAPGPGPSMEACARPSGWADRGSARHPGPQASQPATS